MEFFPRMQTSLKTHSEFERSHSDLCNIRITLHSNYNISVEQNQNAARKPQVSVTQILLERNNLHILNVFSKTPAFSSVDTVTCLL